LIEGGSTFFAQPVQAAKKRKLNAVVPTPTLHLSNHQCFANGQPMSDSSRPLAAASPRASMLPTCDQ